MRSLYLTTPRPIYINLYISGCGVLYVKKKLEILTFKAKQKKRTEEIRMNEDIVTQMIYMLQCFI